MKYSFESKFNIGDEVKFVNGDLWWDHLIVRGFEVNKSGDMEAILERADGVLLHAREDELVNAKEDSNNLYTITIKSVIGDKITCYEVQVSARSELEAKEGLTKHILSLIEKAEIKEVPKVNNF